MSTKTAYVWGPVSNFSSSLLALLLENGWTLHVACKSALQISLSPLDLASSAQHSIEKAAGGAEKIKPYHDNLVFLESEEPQKGTTYDIILFMGLPSNFDEPRVSRSPWAAEELAKITARLKGVPVLVISSLWGGVQEDGVVPEEIEFQRRKPRSHFEGVCQQYETRILKGISTQDGKWHLVRLPLILGNAEDGRSVNFTGLYKLLQELCLAKYQLGGEGSADNWLDLQFNPDATFWMLPCDWAASLIYRLIEDSSRPVICNVVSTQATLNQEWLQDLARALEIQSINAVDKDGLSLPAALRSMLADNIQVKSRNLFEVLGRYQQAPMKLTSEYFAKVLSYASQNNWGQLRQVMPEPPFSQENAARYFDEFLPSRLDQKMLKTLAKFSRGLAFEIAGEDCGWLLTSDDAKTAKVVSLDTATHKPQVTFSIAGQSFARLVSGKLMFEQALLSRSLQVSGNPIESLKACDFFRRILRKLHYETPPEDREKVLESSNIS